MATASAGHPASICFHAIGVIDAPGAFGASSGMLPLDAVAPANAYQPRHADQELVSRVVAAELDGFLAAAEERGHPWPSFVASTFRDFLNCGLPEHGFLRVRCDECDRDRVCRYMARPPLASERLERLPDGRILYRLRHRWRDGTSALVFEAREFLARLAAQIPPPRAHQVRYHGVLAPCAARWPFVIPVADGVEGDAERWRFAVA